MNVATDPPLPFKDPLFMESQVFKKLGLMMILFLPACVTSGEFSDEYIEIPEEYSRLDTSNLPYEFDTLKRYGKASTRRYEELIWAKKDSVATAEFYYVAFKRGLVVATKENRQNFETWDTDWKAFEGRNFSHGPIRKVETDFGGGYYRISEKGLEHCLLTMLWGRASVTDDNGRPESLMSGYLCAYSHRFPNEDEILDILESFDDSDYRYDGTGLRNRAQ